MKFRPHKDLFHQLAKLTLVILRESVPDHFVDPSPLRCCAASHLALLDFGHGRPCDRTESCTKGVHGAAKKLCLPKKNGPEEVRYARSPLLHFHLPKLTHSLFLFAFSFSFLPSFFLFPKDSPKTPFFTNNQTTISKSLKKRKLRSKVI